MTLRDQLETDATTVFLSSNDFAETVTYYPHNFAGQVARSSRSILAVVVRTTPVVFDQDGEHAIPTFEVHVANSSTSGISSDEIDVGRDQIGMAVREGVTAKRRTITRMQEHDNGMLVLECR